MGGCCATQADRDPRFNKPSVRMCSSGNHFPNFADIGNTVVLFVDFGNNFKPVPKQNLDHSLGGATAGRVRPDRNHLEAEQYEVNHECYHFSSLCCSRKYPFSSLPYSSGYSNLASYFLLKWNILV